MSVADAVETAAAIKFLELAGETKARELAADLGIPYRVRYALEYEAAVRRAAALLRAGMSRADVVRVLMVNVGLSSRTGWRRVNDALARGPR